mmetsp:Transcript_36601/g.92466  ORF Transcript_36601/g.92466 Transcript_36601/m.92466 type:complete len:375 (-) Transcript_36601:1082-2206(-)
MNLGTAACTLKSVTAAGPALAYVAVISVTPESLPPGLWKAKRMATPVAPWNTTAGGKDTGSGGGAGGAGGSLLPPSSRSSTSAATPPADAPTGPTASRSSSPPAAAGADVDAGASASPRSPSRSPPAAAAAPPALAAALDVAGAAAAPPVDGTDGRTSAPMLRRYSASSSAGMRSSSCARMGGASLNMRVYSDERDCTSSAALRLNLASSACRRGTWPGRRAVSFMAAVSAYSRTTTSAAFLASTVATRSTMSRSLHDTAGSPSSSGTPDPATSISPNSPTHHSDVISRLVSATSWYACRLRYMARTAYACRSGALVMSTMSARHTSSLTYDPACVITCSRLSMCQRLSGAKRWMSVAILEVRSGLNSASHTAR